MKHESTQCYRMRPSLGGIGFSVTLLAGGMAICTFVAWCNQPANNPANMPAVIAGCLAFTTLGLYLLLRYYRYRLFVGDSSIRQTCILRDQQADLSAIDEVKWRRFPQGGSVWMTGLFGVLKVELGNFKTEDRQQLISILRASIPESRQFGWQRFDEQFANTPEKRQQSIRVRLLLAVIFGVNVVVFGIIWAIGGGVQYLVLSGINGMMTAYLLRSYRLKRAERNVNWGEPIE